MIPALDSATPPSPNAVAQAKAAGIKVWSGYLATKPNVNLFRIWNQAEFDTARGCGGMPIAYCSGLDDPVACKYLAEHWNVRLCLDVENGIRGDGPWVQQWLNDSGAGLYGNLPVHSGRTAPFHILAAYPGGNPNATWEATGRPSTPCGWQFQGTHNQFGMGVDSTWLDDWFLGDEMTPQQADVIAAMFVELGLYINALYRWPESDAAVEGNAVLFTQPILNGDRAAMERAMSAVFTGGTEAQQKLAFRNGLPATISTMQKQIAALQPTAPQVTMDEVKAEIAKTLKAALGAV